MAFRTSGHRANAMTTLASFRKSNYLCDVVIVSRDGERFPAHRVILATASPVFRTMFKGYKESEQTDVALPHIAGSAIEAIIDYAYIGETHNAETQESVQDIYEAAHYLQNENLLKMCSTWLLRRVNATNCLSLVLFADRYDDDALFRVAVRVAATSILKLIDDDEFLALPVEYVRRILACNEMGVKSEDEVLDVVRAWVKRDEAARREHVESLSTFVRFSLLDFEISADCLADLDLVSHYNDSREGSGKGLPSRVGRDGVLLVAGGFTSMIHRTNDVRLYDASSDTWSAFPPMLDKIARSRIASSRGDLYVLSGSGCRTETGEEYSPSGSGQRFQADTGRWERMEARERARHEIVGCNDLIYGMSIAEGTKTDVCEVYLPESKKWECIASPSQKLNGQFYTLSPMEDKIYALGFATPTQYGYMIYDTLEDRWLDFCPLSHSPTSCKVSAKWNYSATTKDRAYIMSAEHSYAAALELRTTLSPDVAVFDRRSGDLSHQYFNSLRPHYGIAADSECQKIYWMSEDEVAIYDERADKMDLRKFGSKFRRTCNVVNFYDFECAIVDRKFLLNFGS